MSISENEVSIIIPTYNNSKLAEKALLSSLRTKAGEIIICDDNSKDDTISVLNKYDDKRIHIISNDTNLGLWENHLRALNHAKLGWIKFLQQDDIITEDGLKKLCEQADKRTAIVGTLPVMLNLEMGEKRIPQSLSKPRRWTSEEYLERLTNVGYELGNPSMTLIRRDAFNLDESVWKSDISADYIQHVVVPIKGDVVIIPPGAVIINQHKMQDAQTVSFSLVVRRMANTLNYLSHYPNEKVKLHAKLVAFLESFGFLIYAFGQIRRKRKLYKGFFADWLKIVKVIKIKDAITNVDKLITLFRTKYFGYNKNLDRY